MTTPPPFPGTPGPPPGWSAPAYNPPQPSPTARQGGKLATAAAAAGVVVAIAALVVALTRHPAPAPAPAKQTTSAASDTTEVDKALCTAIAPLLKQSQAERNAFIEAGPAGSPAADAALPKFVDDTKQWAKQTQQALDADPGPQRHLTRTAQRYIDDMLLFVEGLRPGAGNKYDESAWTDASESENGPIMVCYGVGVKW